MVEEAVVVADTESVTFRDWAAELEVGLEIEFEARVGPEESVDGLEIIVRLRLSELAELIRGMNEVSTMEADVEPSIELVLPVEDCSAGLDDPGNVADSFPVGELPVTERFVVGTPGLVGSLELMAEADPDALPPDEYVDIGVVRMGEEVRVRVVPDPDRKLVTVKTVGIED